MKIIDLDPNIPIANIQKALGDHEVIQVLDFTYRNIDGNVRVLRFFCKDNNEVETSKPSKAKKDKANV